MEYFLIPFLFVFGLLIGSFLNVVVLRYDTGASISKGRSKCFSCDKTLSWYELLPLLSFAFQGGRCRGCRAKISWQYPLVELLGGLVPVCSYFLFPRAFSSFYGFADFIILSAILFTYVAILVYDLRHKIIPDVFSYTAAALALALIGLSFASDGIFDFSRLIAGAALFLFFFFFWFVSRGTWMGLGDAKLALSVGFVLGISGGVAAILLSFWIGTIAALLIILVQRLRGGKRLGLKSEIPFGPYILIGFLVVLLFHIDMQAIFSLLAV